MKRIFTIVLILSAVVLVLSGKSTRSIFSPDRLFIVGDGMVVANRAERQLLKLTADGQNVAEELKLSTAVSDLVQLPDGDMWVACEGNTGWLYLVDGERFAVKRKVESGATPSAVTYNEKSRSLWVAQRFANELWEVDAATGEQMSVVKVGREPVDMISLMMIISCLLPTTCPRWRQRRSVLRRRWMWWMSSNIR